MSIYKHTHLFIKITITFEPTAKLNILNFIFIRKTELVVSDRIGGEFLPIRFRMKTELRTFFQSCFFTVNSVLLILSISRLFVRLERVLLICYHIIWGAFDVRAIYNINIL